MTFPIGTLVFMCSDSRKHGAIAGQREWDGRKWFVPVLFGKKPRLVNEENLREDFDRWLSHIHVPHGLVVGTHSGDMPTIYQQSDSKANQDEIDVFVETMSRMWAQA